MKKFFYLVAAVAMLFTACEFDPTDLNNRIDDLENRVTELEETIAALNQDIAGVETLVNAMQNNVYVSKIVKGENGYEVYFTNGEKIEIADGKAGEAGKDGVTVTVMLDEEDGQYYWAVIKDGVTSFIEVDGKRLPVKGEQGNTPKMRVVMEGETGYWEVSYDNGETWERVLLEDGTPVTTSGGAGGLFKEAYIDEDTNTAVFVFLNGETLEIELRSDLYVNFKGEAVESADFRYGETKTFEMEAVGVVKAIVTTPDEWKASFDKTNAVWSITAPSIEHALCADLEGEVALIYFGEENQSSVVTMNVSIGEFVEVAEENLVIEAEAAEAIYDVPFTADGAVTVEPVDAWLSGTVAEGVAKITVAANTGAARTGTIKLVAKSNEVVITVNQVAGVELQEKGLRPNSEQVMWATALADLGVTANAVTSIAVVGDKLVVNANGEAPVILNGLTGEKEGTIDLGDVLGQNYAVASDDCGNLLFHTFNAGVIKMARMKGLTGTPEWFIEHNESATYACRVAVSGDLYGNAVIATGYEGGASTANFRYDVVNGVASAPVWHQYKNGSATPTRTAVTYLYPSATSDYMITGYSVNKIFWVDGDTDEVIAESDMLCDTNMGVLSLDAVEFNKNMYLTAIYDTFFTWSTAGGVLYDISTVGTFNQIASLNLGDMTAKANGSGLMDVVMTVSDNGVYMYVYAMFTNGAVGCIRYDCLKNAPEE